MAALVTPEDLTPVRKNTPLWVNTALVVRSSQIGDSHKLVVGGWLAVSARKSRTSAATKDTEECS